MPEGTVLLAKLNRIGTSPDCLLGELPVRSLLLKTIVRQDMKSSNVQLYTMDFEH